MTLREAVREIISDTMAWMKANEMRPKWVEENLTSFFLFDCHKKLKSTPDFAMMYSYRLRYIFRGRHLIYEIKSGKLKSIRFQDYSSAIPGMLTKLNSEFSDALFEFSIHGLPAEYNRELLNKVERTKGAGIAAEAPVIYDTRRIDSFNFKPSGS